MNCFFTVVIHIYRPGSCIIWGKEEGLVRFYMCEDTLKCELTCPKVTQ